MIPDYLFIQAIMQLDPNARWDVFGEGDIRILDSAITREQVEAKALELQALEIHNQYQRDRAQLYPFLGEQLDMLWHDINNGILGEAAKNSTWYQAIKDIKDSHPKPE